MGRQPRANLRHTHCNRRPCGKQGMSRKDKLHLDNIHPFAAELSAGIKDTARLAWFLHRQWGSRQVQHAYCNISNFFWYCARLVFDGEILAPQYIWLSKVRLYTLYPNRINKTIPLPLSCTDANLMIQFLYWLSHLWTRQKTESKLQK
jgi:hypothetical protein